MLLHRGLPLADSVIAGVACKLRPGFETRHVVALPGLVACVSGAGSVQWFNPSDGGAAGFAKSPPLPGRVVVAGPLPSSDLETVDSVTLLDDAGFAAALSRSRPCTSVTNVGGVVQVLAAGGRHTVAVSRQGTLTSISGLDDMVAVLSAQRVVPPVASLGFIDTTRLWVLHSLDEVAEWDLSHDILRRVPREEVFWTRFSRVERKVGTGVVAASRHGPTLMFHTARYVMCPRRGHLYSATTHPQHYIEFFSPSPCGEWVAVVVAGGEAGPTLELLEVRSLRVVASIACFKNDAWACVRWPSHGHTYCAALTRCGEVLVLRINLP